jgi:hypothetical protein
MKNVAIIMGLILALVLGLALQVAAVSITYTGSDTNYSVTSVTPSANIKENYGATSAIPSEDLGFSSHDGYAVVDYIPELALFTKTVTLESGDIKTNFSMTFDITNTGPFTWSDYHISLDGDTLPIIVSVQSSDFKNATFSNSDHTADYAVSDPIDGSKFIDPNKVLHLTFTLNTSSLNAGDSFTMTQIATTTPIPPTALLLGSGLLGLCLLGWRRCQTN